MATVGYRFVSKVEVVEDASGNLDATGTATDRGETGFVGTPGNGQIPDDARNPVPSIDKGAETEGRNGKQPDERHNGLWNWALFGTVAVVIGLAAAAWYVRRPLPPLRVIAYIPITRDGDNKDVAGTDGSRVYFNRNYELQRTAEVAVSGGEIVQVPVALPLAWINDVSPDGSTLLVTSSDGGQGSLWDVDVPAGTLRRLLTDARVVSAAWSPDGNSVVYSTNGDLYVIGSDGTGTHKLGVVGGLPTELSWSPDGTKIRFSKDNRLWEISSDGGGLHLLLPGWHTSASQCCGRWTPDGKFFVFVSRGAFYAYNGFVDASQLWVLDERHSFLHRAATEPVQLTSGPIRWNTRFQVETDQRSLPIELSCVANWIAMTRRPVVRNRTWGAFQPTLSHSRPTVSLSRTSLSLKAYSGGPIGMEVIWSN